MKQISIHLLGSFEVYINGEPATRFEYAKVRALLAYLALESYRPQSRVSLSALLWPDQPERSARGSLSQALTTLRNALGEKNAQQPILLTTVDTVQLDLHGGIEVDVTQFLTLLRDAESHDHYSWRTCASCADRLRQAVALYHGNFLANFFIADSSAFEEWAGLQREYLLQRALSTLGRLVEWAQWRGAYVEAIGYARKQVSLEPLLEINQRVLLRLLALNGEVPAALAHYTQFKQFLLREMEAEAEEATVALSEQIRRGDVADLRLRQAPFAVPLPPTLLIGRTQEARAVCEHLRDAKIHLLTIAGTGGVGKTRLAIEVAAALRYDFEDGVYFVDLAPLRDASLVINAIAQVLGVLERPEQDTAQALRVHLRSRHLLLICDNFEHVLPAAPLIAELLAACSALKILVTSREPLVLRAEQQFILKPLADAEAVQLFLQSAQAISADLSVDQESLDIYLKICRRLDGLPLAIELIAAHAHMLSPIELLSQLDRPLEALTSGWRDAPKRHQALRNAIQWSYDLLEIEEQRVFAHLGVFAGGCTAAAVQAVVGDAPSVLPSLEVLCAVNLVQAQPLADETRFTLLETIREFAVEKLIDLGKYVVAQERQAAFFAKRTEAAEPALAGPEQASWIQRIAADRENLRAALTWWYAKDPDVGLQMITALWYFYEMRGPIREGREWLNSFLEKATTTPPELRAKALWVSGIFENRAGHYIIATTRLEDSLRLYEALADIAGIASAHNVLGNVAFEQEQYEIAASHYHHSLEIRRRLGDRYGIASTLNNLALCSHLTHKLQEAEALFQESLGLYRELGDQDKVASVFGNMASLAITRSDPHQAKRLCEESLVLYRELGGRRGIGIALNGLGEAALKMNDLTTARAHFISALQLYLELMDLIGVIEGLAGLAATARTEGAFEHAAKLLGAIAAVSEDNQVSLSGDARRGLVISVEAIRSSLDPAQYERAWAAGRKLTLEQAIALALE